MPLRRRGPGLTMAILTAGTYRSPQPRGNGRSVPRGGPRLARA